MQNASLNVCLKKTAHKNRMAPTAVNTLEWFQGPLYSSEYEHGYNLENDDVNWLPGPECHYILLSSERLARARQVRTCHVDCLCTE